MDTYDVLESNYDNNIVSIIAKYDEASLIVSELCTMDFSIFSCELHDPEFAGYTDEYLIEIIEDKSFVSQQNVTVITLVLAVLLYMY